MNFNLTVNSCNPPIDTLIIAEIINIRYKDIIEVTWCNDWKYEGNVRLYGKDILLLEDKNNTIGRYFARTMDPDLYGSDNPNDRTEIDHWLSFMVDPLRSSILKENIMSYLDRTLMTRTWLVTKKLTIADISVFSVLIEEQSFVKYEKKYPNVFRWYKEMLSLPAIVTVLATIEKNKISVKDMKDHRTQKSFNTKAQQGNCKQEGKFINLPGAKMGEVVVRFPPEPSGYLHIGHAKAVLLNQYYADTSQGKLIIRFDDTNPAKENVTFMQAILEDLDLLQIKSHKITHTSDYFDVILDYCTKLIEEGKAYVDDTPAEIMKEQRDRKEPSVNRENSVKKNLLLWEEMQQGTNEGQKCCVRAKIDYKSTNGCLRDPTIYRCKPEPHPRTGRKYAVYPTYDFACPIVDVIENVTHTLRTTEYHDRDDQFYWVIDALGLYRPYIWEYSRLNMTNTVLSKRKLTWFVTEGLVDGWDDPRLPTVRGILRRGMTVDGLKQFIIAQGSSRSVVFMEWDKIWALNKKIIDPIAHRYTALDRADMVPVHVIDAKDEWLTVQNHPKDPSKGTKIVHVSSNIFIERNDADTLVEGQDTTFINWGNLLIQKIERRNSAVTKIQAKLNLDNKNYKNTLKITWLSASSGNKEDRLVPCYAVYFDHIINQPVLGKEEDFKHFITKNSRREVHMLGEAELKRVKKGEIIELQRKGFFRCDVQYDLSSFSSKERPVILFHIPDGRSGTFGTNRLTDAVGKKSVKTNSGELTDNAGERAGDKRGEATVAVRLETSSHLKSASGTDKSATNPKFTAVSSLATNANCRRLANQLTERYEKVKQLEDLLRQEKMHVQSLKMEYKNSTGMEWELKQPCTIVMSDCANNKDNAELRVEDFSEVSREIEKQGNKIRELKNAGTAKDILDKEVKLLLSLKNDYKALTGGKDWMPSKADDIRSADKPSDEQKETLCANEMSEEIGKQADKVRQLKLLKAEKTIIDREVKTLLRLKSDYTSATGTVWQQTKETLRKNKRSESNPPMKNVHSKNITAKESDTNKTGTRLGLEAKKKENFFDWYSQVITKSGMIEYYDVSGCYILRPWSYAIWKIIKEYIDNEITDLGVQECYFPIFVTRTVLEKEKTHIADFAPEVAWVTKCGNSDLIEPIAIRPTSETVMYPAYAKWLRSDTELPLRLNQWNNVVRWEFKDPKPFLRTREFLWQEGHTAFATKAEADAEVLIILDMYSRVYEQLLAVPVIKGRKTEKEKFAGGEYTTTVEAFISTSGRAVQGATSHHLGQNFSKMFNIQVEGMAAATEGDGKTFVYQNSWGLTTRTIGVMIMVHGDDKGLVLPPNVSSVQAVLVPCGITANTTTEERDLLQAECVKLVNELMKDKDLRLKADYRSNRTPGWKFNHWELKGVPVRIELGPKDVKRDEVTFVRRDTSEKIIVNRSAVRESLRQLLQDIQNSMLVRARKDLNEHIKQTENWNTFGIELNKKNLLLSPFCGEPSCEERIKMDSAREDTGEELGALFMGAKSLCIPFQQPQSRIPIEHLHCIHPDCQNKSKFYALFGRSY